MKKIFLPFLFLSLLITSCGGSDSNDSACGNVASFTAIQQNENVTVTLNSTATPLYYEVSVNQTPQSNINPNNGTIKTMTTTTQTFSLGELNMLPGYTYVFYVRTACTDGSKSKWSNPVSLGAEDYCYIPKNLGMTYSGVNAAFKWDADSFSPTPPTYYQVEYGLEGFTHGSGTTVQVNTTQYSAMTMLAGHTYDFYVRAYCNVSLGWSSWAGPYTYLSVDNQNTCSMPLNPSAEVENYSGSSVNIGLHWLYNGESNFEYALMRHGYIPSPSDIHTHNNPATYPVMVVNRYYDYDFYVRAVCSDGSRTNWTTPVVVYP